MTHRIVPVKTYVTVFIALIVLTGLTVGAALVNLGLFNTVVALAIAGAKMLLVMYFFMHLRDSTALIRVVLLAGFFWLAILMSFTLSDYHTRSWNPDPAAWAPSSRATHP